MQFSAINAQKDSLRGGCALVLQGVVIDGESNTPLSDASVVITELKSTAVTTTEGAYLVSSLCPGRYTVKCQFAGYKTISVSIDITDHVVKNFILHADTWLMESVVVTATKAPNLFTQPITELYGRDLDITRGLSLGESLKNIAGVNSLQTGPSISKPMIQGMYGNRVLILNNGIRQEGQQWSSEHAPEIDPFIASNITVIKGPKSIQYGSEAIGGVVLVNPKPFRSEPGLSGEANLVGLSNGQQGAASGQIDYTFKKLKGLSLRLQGTIKQAGNIKTPDYYLINTGFKEQNFSWAANYQKEKFGANIFYSQFNTTLGIFSAAHIGNLTDLKRAIESNVPLERAGFTYHVNRPRQEVSHELTKVQAHYHLSQIGKINLILARQFNYRSEYDKHRPYNNALKNEPQSEFKITTYTANASLEQATRSPFVATIGLQFMNQGNTVSGTVRPFIPNFASHTVGAYLLERWLQQRWLVEAGIRYDIKWMQTYKYENSVLISPKYSFSNASFTVGASYTLNEFVKFSSNLGTSFRPPAVNELFAEGVHVAAGRKEYGDRTLKSEYVYSWSANVNIDYKNLFGEITVYNNYSDNYIYLSPGILQNGEGTPVPEYELSIRGAFPVSRFRQINANFTGVDATINNLLTRNILFSTKLSLLRAFNTQSKQHLILTPPSNFQYSFRYQLPSLGQLQEPSIKITHGVVLKKSKVPTYEDFKAPPPGYMLLTAEAGSNIRLGKLTVDLYFTVYNLLNTRYRDYLNAFRYYADAPGRNFVLRAKIPFSIPKK